MISVGSAVNVGSRVLVSVGAKVGGIKSVGVQVGELVRVGASVGSRAT